MSTYLTFTFVGALSGATIAFSLDMKTPKEILQGVIGGIIAGFLMSLMLPH